jgi:hypothetical protein
MPMIMRRVLAWSFPAAVAGCVALVGGGQSGDGGLFVAAGRTLLSSDWSRAFSRSDLQVGPLQLAVFGSIGRSHDVLALVLGVLATLLVVAAAHAVGVRHLGLLSGCGLVAVAVGFTRVGYELGHPADPMLPLIWILAAAEARRGRALRAGLLVGVCAGIETWGILGIAVLFVAPRWRDVARGAALAAGVAAALFLPFVLGGHFAMETFRWHVTSGSLLSLFVPSGAAFGWPLRMAQGVVAVAAGVVTARLTRRSEHSLWLVALVVVVVRLVLDPILMSYYFSGIEGPMFVGATLVLWRAWTTAHRRPSIQLRPDVAAANPDACAPLSSGRR